MPSQDLNPGCRTQSPAHWPLDYSRLTDIFILQVVLTTLLVACSASFVLNAYNFLFLKRFAIYVWFAIAPLIWVVCPLTGAAWVTKTYVRYKLVVVNAWVDIPEVWWFFLLLTLLSVNDSDAHNWDLNSHFTQSINQKKNNNKQKKNLDFHNDDFLFFYWSLWFFKFSFATHNLITIYHYFCSVRISFLN